MKKVSVKPPSIQASLSQTPKNAPVTKFNFFRYVSVTNKKTPKIPKLAKTPRSPTRRQKTQKKLIFLRKTRLPRLFL